ncbi:hypothetical protein ACKZDW_02270 (plasmid) [Ralstonia syzygii subsp. celebesensis]|uniref:hypothetical protein n=1 Tax=Ralstonia syzygii TaxID=28097 RepID=UPI00387E0EDA
MNASDTKWAQGQLATSGFDSIFPYEPHEPYGDYELTIVRDTDYVLLQMMGKIAHRADTDAAPTLPAVPSHLPKTS